MTTVVVLVVVLLVVLALGWWALQYRRTQGLRRRFGGEYDRTLERTGNRRETEQTLGELAQRRDELTLRPLTPQQRESWVQQWGLVQSRFVDAPGEAVTTARELLPALMRDRGYPTEDFDRRAALLATDHPVVVAEYRAAEQAYQRHAAGGGSSTEALRQSLVHYRALFDALVDPREGAGRDPAADATGVEAAPSDERRADETRTENARLTATEASDRTVVADGARTDVVDDEATHGRHAQDAPADQPVEDSPRGARR